MSRATGAYGLPRAIGSWGFPKLVFWGPSWGPWYKGTLLFGVLYQGSLFFVNPHLAKFSSDDD